MDRIGPTTITCKIVYLVGAWAHPISDRRFDLEPFSYAAERSLFGALPLGRCLRRHIPVDKAGLLYAHSKDFLEECSMDSIIFS